MGQAKNRKSEIEALKAAGPKLHTADIASPASEVSIFGIDPDGSTSTAAHYTLRNLQKMVKGNIGELPIFKSHLARFGIYAYINDSFLLNGMSYNPIASKLAGFKVCGPAIFVNIDEGEPLTSTQLQLLQALVK